MIPALACAALGIPTGLALSRYVAAESARRAGSSPVLGAREGGNPPLVHPEVVGVTVVAFGGMGARLGWGWELPAFLVLAAASVVVAVIDLRHFVVPNRAVAAALLAGGPLLVLAAAVDDRWDDLGRAAAGAALASAALLVMNLVNPSWMGMGDVKLAVVLGMYLGWLGLGHVPVGLFLGFALGALVGVVLIATGLRGRKDHIPFAPFLVAGAYLAVLFGHDLLDWYVR